jgi:hypothetical protein
MKHGCTAGRTGRIIETLVLFLARYLVRLGTRLRRRVTTDMNLSEYLAQFGDVMATANHSSSWGVAGMTNNGFPGRVFAFVSVDPTRIAATERLLGAAGLLCETTLLNEGEPTTTETLAVQALVSGMRAVGGGDSTSC